MYYYTAFDNKILLQQIVILKEKIILAWTFSQILIKPIMKFLLSDSYFVAYLFQFVGLFPF